MVAHADDWSYTRAKIELGWQAPPLAAKLAVLSRRYVNVGTIDSDGLNIYVNLAWTNERSKEEVEQKLRQVAEDVTLHPDASFKRVIENDLSPAQQRVYLRYQDEILRSEIESGLRSAEPPHDIIDMETYLTSAMGWEETKIPLHNGGWLRTRKRIFATI